MIHYNEIWGLQCCIAMKYGDYNDELQWSIDFEFFKSIHYRKNEVKKSVVKEELNIKIQIKETILFLANQNGKWWI